MFHSYLVVLHTPDGGIARVTVTAASEKKAFVKAQAKRAGSLVRIDLV